MPYQRNARASARAVGQIVFVSIFAFAALTQPALADYAGKTLLMWASSNVIAPLGILSLVVALGAAFFRPEFVQKAIYAVIICVLLFLYPSDDSRSPAS